MIDRSSDGAWLARRSLSRLLSRHRELPCCHARDSRALTPPLPGDSLRINFNVSFPHLQCQYASVDVSDVLGMVRTSALWLRCAALTSFPRRVTT